MSLHVSVLCDRCGVICAEAPTAVTARQELREDGGRTTYEGARRIDLCARCAKKKEPPR